MKKIKMLVIAVIAMMVPSFLVHAADTVECTTDHEAEINGTCYATLIDAVGAVTGEDQKTIVIKKDVQLTTNAVVVENKNIVIDLNGFNITRNGFVFNTDNATLKFTGKGVIENTVARYNDPAFPVTIYMYGNANLTIDADVTVKGYDAIGMMAGTNSVDVYGTLISKIDLEVKTGNRNLPTLGSGIYSYGDSATINIHDGAGIDGEGVGLYLNCSATTTIGKATVRGASGIAMKSGKLTLNGSTIVGTYEYLEPNPVTNGIETTGAAIQIESDAGNENTVEISINGGTYTSEHGYALQEYTDATADTSVNKIEITNGALFESNPEEGNGGISVSKQFAEAFKDESFIEAGTVFTSNGEAAKDVLTYTEDLGISESGVVGKVYKISVEDENGKVTVNGDAAKGEEVTFTVTANDGYELDTLVVTDEEGNTIVVKDNKFTMPESNVTITATFKKIVVEEEKPTETEPNPDTYDAGVSYMGLALLSLGTMIVSIKKLRNN